VELYIRPLLNGAELSPGTTLSLPQYLSEIIIMEIKSFSYETKPHTDGNNTEGTTTECRMTG
jgi:hypothetical protein